MSAVLTAEDGATTAARVDEGAYPKGLYPWYVVVILLLVSTLSHVDRHSINILVMPIQHDMGLSETQMGLLLGPAFMLFYVAAGLPMGKIADHYSRRNLLTAGLVVWSIGTLAGGFARNFEQLFAARAVVGLGEACLIPAAFSLVVDYFPPSRRGRATAAVSIGFGIGAGLALISAGMVLEFMQQFENRPLPIIGEKTAWELVFITFGLVGVLMGFLLLTIREPARLGIRKAAGDRATFIGFMRSTGGSIFLILAPYFLINFMLHAFAAWAPVLFVRRLGLSIGDAAQLKGWVTMIASVLAMIAGGMAGDYLTRKRKEGRYLLILFLGPVLLPAVALTCLGMEIWLVALGMGLFLGAGSFVMSTAYAAIGDVVPAEVRGRTLALYTVCSQLMGLGFAPAFVALITEHLLGDAKLLHYSIILATIPAYLLMLLLGAMAVPRFRTMRRELAEEAPEAAG